jgi:integrase
MPIVKRETLTKDRIDKAKPGETLRDTKPPGLILRVHPSGRKSWSVAWGRGQARQIGVYDVMTLTGARITATKMLAEIAEHGAPVNAARGKADTLAEFMAGYAKYLEATAKSGAATVAAIKSVFGDWYPRRLSSLTVADWDTLKAERLKAKIRPATVNRDLDRIKAALQQAVTWGDLKANPLASVKRIKRGIESRVRYLSPKEAKALRKALDAREARRKAERTRGEQWREARGRKPLGAFQGYTDHFMPLVLLALNTGMRRGELRQVQWADIDMRAKVLTVRAGYAKSGKSRAIPLNTEAMAVLKAWRKQRPDPGPVFGVASVQTAWEGLMTEAKIEDFRFHDCRHDFASRLVMAGVALIVVRDLLGHSSIEMTERYAHLAPMHHAQAVQALVAR